MQLTPPLESSNRPTPTPPSPAARRPACQAQSQRSAGLDTPDTAACQIPLDMSPERRPKEVPIPALQTVTSVSPYRPTVPYHPFFSLVLHCTRDTFHRMARQPWRTWYWPCHAFTVSACYCFANALATYCNISSGALDTTQCPRTLALRSSTTNRLPRTVLHIRKSQMLPTKPPTTTVHGWTEHLNHHWSGCKTTCDHDATPTPRPSSMVLGGVTEDALSPSSTCPDGKLIQR